MGRRACGGSLGKVAVDCFEARKLKRGLRKEHAISDPRLAACAVNYGPLPTNTADIWKIDVPVLGVFGSLDRGISPDKVRAFERCMNAAGERVDAGIYDGAGHAFEEPSNQRGYQPRAAAVAWFETLKFFERVNALP
jgi:carboxymethylenebutenolidase